MKGLIRSEQQKNSRAVFHPSRIIPLIVLTILALVGTSCTRAEANTIVVNTAEHGTATVDRGDANAGTIVTLTCVPEAGYKVASAKYSYTGRSNNAALERTINMNGNRGVFEAPDFKDNTSVTITVTFETYTALAGGDTADSPAEITDNTIVGLSGGYYAVKSDISFDHDIILSGDVTLTIAKGATMIVNGIINGNNYRGSLTVSGDGALTVESEQTGIVEGEYFGTVGTLRYGAIDCVESYTQTGATVSIDNAGYYGMFCNNIIISGGTLTTEGSSVGIYVEYNIDIIGGVVTAKAEKQDSDPIDIIAYRTSFNIFGGQFTANTNGIRKYTHYNEDPIYIGYTESTDFITAKFLSSVTVKDNCMFTDGTNDYSGGLNTSDVNGKTLTPKICTVTIEGDNITADTTSTLYGKTVTLTYTEEVPAGYDLYFTVNGTAITENTFTIKEDSKVAVVLAPITYSIGYTLNGGTADNPTAYTVESDDFTLSNPTKTGYTFTGWTGSNDLTTPNETVTIKQGSTGNRTYTANWKANTYTVKFDANDGEGTMESQSYTYDTAQAITANTFTRKGYKFTGWKISANATNTSYSNSETVKNLATSGEITLYADWSAIAYHITYNLDGGSLADGESNPSTYTIKKEVTLNNPTKDGYKFVGWTGTDLDGAVTTVTIEQGSIGDRTYTANWAKLFSPAPEFAYHSMILSGQIGVIFYVYAPGIESSDCYVYFDVNGDKSQNTQPVYAFEEITDNGYTLYGYKCYINSVQMADTINAVFQYGDNKTVTHTYTAAEYLSGITQETTQTADTIALGKAIMDLGSYVQPVLAESNGWEIGKKHAKMTSADTFDETDFSQVSADTAAYAIQNGITDSSGIANVEFALVLDSETTIELYLTPKSDYTGDVYAYIGDNTTDNMAVQDGDIYTVSIGNIPAHKLGETYTVHISTQYTDAAEVSFDVNISALSYVNAAIQQIDDTDTKNAVTSLYYYYDATMTYRNNRPDIYSTTTTED